MTTTIVLVRHGETDWNRERRFQGHADPPLNAVGRAQAGEVARELAAEPVAALYTSPLRRAAETAEIVGTELGVQIRTSAALMEVDVGSWSGLTVGEVEARYPAGYRRWRASGHGWEDGETYEELGARVVSGLHDLAGRHPGEVVLAVTHGGPIRSALAAVEAVGFADAQRSLPAVPNCAIVRVAVRDGSIDAVD